MASQESVGQVVFELTALGHSISSVIKSPINPYGTKDRPKLREQREAIFNEMISLSDKDEALIDQGSVNDALECVRVAQNHYNAILKTHPPIPNEYEVDISVGQVIEKVSAL